MTSDDPFLGTSGPKDAKVILVGEAWGEEEARQHQPFVGSSGWVLSKMLQDAGLHRDSVLLTNVVNARPRDNDFSEFLFSNDDAKKAKEASFLGIFARPRLAQGVHDLWQLIRTVRPMLVVAAGNWPLWALSPHATVKTVRGYKHPAGIANWRGSQTFTRSDVGVTTQLLPIYHPAAIMREWKLRATTVHDLRARAWRFLTGACAWTAPESFINHKPDFDSVVNWLEHCEGWLSVDIETYRRRFISCVGLADARGAICIPFFSFNKEGKCIPYFSELQEAAIWQKLKSVLEDPRTKIIGQNFAYDTQFFKRWYDINALVSFDTMVAHHLLYPGTPKGLDDLASFYCEHYTFWKKESQDWDTKEFGAEAHWLYNAKDALFTFEIAMALHSILQQEKMQGLYAFQIEQWRLAREMTLRGVRCDSGWRQQMRATLAAQRAEIERWLEAAGPPDMTGEFRRTPWFHSPTAMIDLFYNQLGFAAKQHKKTGRPTMDDSALQLIEERQPWLAPMMQRIRYLRSIDVFTSHFLDARISADNRWHCQFNIAQPKTFRWSSSATGFDEGTNLQNVPKPTEE